MLWKKFRKISSDKKGAKNKVVKRTIHPKYNALILNPFFLVVVTLLSSFLLNAPVKLIALKFKTWNFSENASKYILIIFIKNIFKNMRYIYMLNFH